VVTTLTQALSQSNFQGGKGLKPQVSSRSSLDPPPDGGVTSQPPLGIAA